MKPIYCNTASITNNKKTGEVSISFTHIYNEHKMSVANGGMTDVSMPVVSEEACIVMNRAGFLALKKLVDEIAAQITGQAGG